MNITVNGRSAYSNWPSLEGSPRLLVLLFHGFPDNAETWLPIIPILAARFPDALILAPTMLGYEPSTAGKPDSAYDIDKVVEDYVLWTQYARGSPVHLVGHDWGAVAAFRAQAAHPTLFRSVTTLAIPHCILANAPRALWNVPKQLWLSSYMLVMNLPFVYRPRISQSTPIPYIKSLWDYWSPSYTPSSEQFNSVCNTLHLPGVMDATTAYYRNIRKSAQPAAWQIKWDKVLVVGGRLDGCMAVELFEIDQRAHPEHVKILDNLGHFMHREDPQLVAGVIADNIHSHS